MAAGLDSTVLGESEVLGQVRRAWERAQAEHASGPVLGALFRHAVQTGKRVRSETAIARGTTSLSHVAVDLAADAAGRAGRHPGGRGRGGGDGRGRGPGARRPPGRALVVANRTAERVETLVAGLPGTGGGHRRDPGPRRPGRPAGRGRRGFTTGAALPIPSSPGPTLEAALARRTGRPDLVVVDLGVPRNVDPGGGRLDGLVLLDMDDLRAAWPTP